MQIDAGRGFDEGEPVAGELEYSAFGDVENFLAAFNGGRAVEGNLLDALDEFGNESFVGDFKRPVINFYVQALDSKWCAENNAACVLGDVDKSTDAGKSIAELGDVDVARLINFDRT